jgi:hypothetical protein
MTHARLAAVCLVLASVAPSCRGRATPDELCAALTSKSLHVEKRGELEPKSEWVGGELGLDLMLDYEEPYLAVRFTASDLAHAYCQEGQGGVPWGVWCLEPLAHPFRPATWNKVNELRR